MSDERSDPRVAPETENWLERLLARFGRGRDGARGDLPDAQDGVDLSAREKLMLANVLGFHRLRVSDVMVPRADIVAVSVEATLGEVLQLFRTAGHSRLPGYGETLDEPLGMVHIRDFIDHLAGGRARPATGDSPPGDALRDSDLSRTLADAAILRPVLFVPRSMPAIDLLARMQASRTHMALVIDEYGGTDGLVSIEDLVETVVGDIEDEHDETEHMIVAEEGGALLADARASLEEVSQALGEALGAVASDEVDTLGGLIVTSVGRVPSRGELIAGPNGLEFEVLDADPRRLKRVRIHRRGPGHVSPPAGQPPAAGEPKPAGEPASTSAETPPAEPASSRERAGSARE